MNLRQDGSRSDQDLYRVVAEGWDDVGVAACAFDPEGLLRYANPAFADLVGWEPEPFYGTGAPYPWFEKSDAERGLRQIEAWVGGQLGELGVAGVQFLARHRSGRSLELVVSGTRLEDPDGKPVAFLGVLVEVGADPAPDAEDGLRAAAEHLIQTAELVERSLLAGGGDPGDARLARVPGAAQLSARERDVLRRLGEGLRVSTIASELDIRPATVRNHLKSIYRKTGLRSQARLVSALRLGR